MGLEDYEKSLKLVAEVSHQISSSCKEILSEEGIIGEQEVFELSFSRTERGGLKFKAQTSDTEDELEYPSGMLPDLIISQVIQDIVEVVSQHKGDLFDISINKVTQA